MNESDSVVNSNKGSLLKAVKIIEFDTQNNHNKADRNEMAIDSELGENDRNELQKEFSTISLQQEYIQKIINMEKKRLELQKERRRRYYEKYQKRKNKKTLQESQEILEREGKRRELVNLRQQRYQDKLLVDQLNAQSTTSTLQDKKLQSILKRRREKENHSQEETVQKSIEREERKRQCQRECQRRYREKQRKRTITSQIQTPQSNVIDKDIRKKQQAKERQRRYREKQRKCRITSQIQMPQSNVIDKDIRKKQLAKERLRRFRQRRRENFTRQQKDSEQRIQAEENAIILQNDQVIQEVQMEFSEETRSDQCNEIDTIYVKQDFEDENTFTIADSSTSMEMSILPETVETDEIINVKEENIEIPSPTTRQDFVFVACADTVALNEATICNNRQLCPYCGKTVQQLNMHELVCDGKFVYFCIFCQETIKRRCNIKNHIRRNHSREIANASQHLNSVDKVFQEILAKGQELHISTPEERDQAILELQAANKGAVVQVHKEIYIMTENQQELIIPDSIETHQESTADTQKSNTPFVVMNHVLEVPTIVQIQNIIQDHSVTAEMTKEKNANSIGNKNVETSQESNVPFTIVQKKINPVSVNGQKQANGKKINYFYCNECVYKSPIKARLLKHITKCHNDEVNLKRHECHRCRKNFQYKKHWKAHKATCNVTVYYYCPFCPKSLLFNRMLKHVQLHHPKEIENKKSHEINDLLAAKKYTVECSKISNKKAATIKRCNYLSTKEAVEILADNVLSQHPTEVENKESDETNNLPVAKKKTGENLTVNELSQHPKEVENKESDETKNLAVATKKAAKSLTANNQKAVKAKAKRWIGKSEYFCDHCQYKTFRKDHLVSHIKRKQFMKENDDKVHNVKNIMKFRYTCVFCPLSYAHLRNVKKHVLQKHSSELAERSIDDVLKDVRAKKTILHGSQTSKKANFKHPEIDPYDIDTSTLEYVPVYCFKCNHVKTSFGRAGRRLRNCQDCGTLMIYLCSKCKDMHTIQFPLLANHWKQCTKNPEISQFNLDKLEVYSCSDCSYVGTHKPKFESHLVRSNHKMAEMKKVEEDKSNKNDDEDMEMYNEAKFAIIPCVTDYATMTRRYCSKCDKVVTEDMQKRKAVTNESCQVCETRFHLQCVKCNMNYNSYISIRYHLNSKCFPGDYKCIKCGKHSSNWHLMQKHYLNSHTNKKEALLCEFCSFRSKHRTNFYMHLKTVHPEQSINLVPDNIQLKKRDIDYFCDKCDFTSKRKGSIKVHLQNVHGAKRHKCKLCKFKTRYEASLKRHYSMRHKNYY